MSDEHVVDDYIIINLTHNVEDSDPVFIELSRYVGTSTHDSVTMDASTVCNEGFTVMVDRSGRRGNIIKLCIQEDILQCDPDHQLHQYVMYLIDKSIESIDSDITRKVIRQILEEHLYYEMVISFNNAWPSVTGTVDFTSELYVDMHASNIYKKCKLFGIL